MPVHYDIRDRIAVITLEGRREYNLFSPDYVYKPLMEVMEKYRDDPEVWCALVTAPSDRVAFTYGGDLEALDAMKRGDVSSSRGYNTGGRYGSLLTGLFELKKPVVFAINGLCLGAGTLLMMSLADIVVASEDAKFGWNEMKIGPSGIGVGPGMFVRQLPWRMATEIMFTGRMVEAQEAYRLGFINRVVPKDQVLPTATKIAEEICGNPPLHVQAAKEMAIACREIPYTSGLLQGRLYAEMLRKLPDSKEGPRAFLEKRKPRYTGKTE